MTQSHQPLRAFLPVASDSDFPIQNLPYGAFSTPHDPRPRIGVAIGDFVLDLAALESAGLLDAAGGGAVFSQPVLNPFIERGKAVWSATRTRLTELLREDVATLRDNGDLRARALHPRAGVKMHLPIHVTGYTDFYSSREHATNAGVILRGKDNALMPNWLHIPVGYNGRASTIVVSGTPVRRPLGQMKPPDSPKPVFGPSRRLDIELEIATVVGRTTALGSTLTVDEAQDAIFGFCLLNDWSARDIQAWEYVPLGPFLGKAFATTISPWIVTAEALESFRTPGPAQDPEPLPYLRQTGPHNYDVKVAFDLQPAGAATPVTLTQTNFATMYWSPAQQLAHHAVGGCVMQVGDLLGSGTISGPTRDATGSLLELTWSGAEPVTLPDGGKRTFLEDGDTAILRGWCEGPGYRIGFGEARGTILPAIMPAEWRHA